MTTPHDLLAELAELAGQAAELVTPSELAAVAELVTAAARLAFGAAACSVAVVDEDTDELVYIAASGAGAVEIVGTRLPVGRGLGGWVAQSGQPVAVADLRGDQRFALDVAESTHYVPTALMAVPIEADEGVIGVLSVLDRDATRADAERDLELAGLFAAQAAAGIRAAEAFHDVGRILLRELARAAADGSTIRDALSEAPSARPAYPSERRYFALLAELRTAGEAEQQLALRVLEDVLDYARQKGASSRPR
jgi:GAF domain-containing protein